MSAKPVTFSLSSCEHEYIPFLRPLVYNYTDCGCTGPSHTSTRVCGPHCFVLPPPPTPPAITPSSEADAYQSFPHSGDTHVVDIRVCCVCQENCGYPLGTIFSVDGYSVHMGCECIAPHDRYFAHYAPAPAPIDD